MNFYLQPEQLLDFVEDVGIFKDAGEFLGAGAEGIDGYHDAAVVAGGEFAYNLAFLQVAAYEATRVRPPVSWSAVTMTRVSPSRAAHS